MLMHYFQFRLSYKAEIELVPIYLACSDLPQLTVSYKLRSLRFDGLGRLTLIRIKIAQRKNIDIAIFTLKISIPKAFYDIDPSLSHTCIYSSPPNPFASMGQKIMENQAESDF